MKMDCEAVAQIWAFDGHSSSSLFQRRQKIVMKIANYHKGNVFADALRPPLHVNCAPAMTLTGQVVDNKLFCQELIVLTKFGLICNGYHWKERFTLTTMSVQPIQFIYTPR